MKAEKRNAPRPAARKPKRPEWIGRVYDMNVAATSARLMARHYAAAGDQETADQWIGKAQALDRQVECLQNANRSPPDAV